MMFVFEYWMLIVTDSEKKKKKISPQKRKCILRIYMLENGYSVGSEFLLSGQLLWKVLSPQVCQQSTLLCLQRQPWLTMVRRRTAQTR